MNTDPRILIVGAGPVGLTLACFLAAAGTPFRIIDRKSGPVSDSRALGVHARTLEIMQSLGLADAFLRNGRVTRYMTFHRREKNLFSLDFDVLRKDTRYPFYLILPQAVTEALLYDRLRELGGDVDWQRSLQHLVEAEDHVAADIDGENRTYPFVVGCDGAGSIVRKILGIGFSGLTYDARFVLSEVRIAENILATDATHVIMARDSVIAAIPLPNGAYRLVGPDRMASKELDSGARITFEAFAQFLCRNGLFSNARLHDPSRVVSYRMQKRVADSFMTRRAFLAGDAAHVHSPAGGQGMNMGMQDAANLAWRLSAAVQTGNLRHLPAYGEERRRVALSIAEGTDKAMRRVGSPHLFDLLLMRLVAPLLCRFRQPYRLLHTMSQLGISYARRGDASGVGGRLPWVQLASGGDVHDLLVPGCFTLFLLGDAAPIAACSTVRCVRLIDNRFYRPDPANSDEIVVRAVARDSLARLNGAARVLVRPDGYVAAVDTRPDGNAVASAIAELAGGGFVAEFFLSGLGVHIGGQRLDVGAAVSNGHYPADTAMADGYVSVAREPSLASYEMARIAAKAALAIAGIGGEDLGALVYASIHRHGQPRFWAPGSWLQRQIGVPGSVPVMSVQQGCNGLVQAMATLAADIRAGSGRPVLFAGADRFEGSGFDRWRSDYGLIYGDAAAAVVLSSVGGLARVLHLQVDGAPELEELHRDESPSDEGSESWRWEYDVRRSKKAFLARHGQEGFSNPLNAALLRLRSQLLSDPCWSGTVDWVLTPFVGSKIRAVTYEAAFAGLGRRLGSDIGCALGHLGTTDGWVGLSELLRTGSLVRGDRVLLVSAGVGFSCGLVLLEMT